MIIMSDDITTSSGDNASLSDSWGGGPDAAQGQVLFQPEELDIYANKLTYETFIFHGKKIDYTAIDHLEYDGGSFHVQVIFKDGRALDLGVKIQWLVRPYLSKAQEVSIVRTKNGEAIDGIVVPLVHKSKAS